MPDKPIIIQYKEYANKIVGVWYNRIPDEVLVFSFLNDLTETAQLLTNQKGVLNKATYNLMLDLDNQWYLQIWSKEGKKNGVYRVEILTDSMLTVSSMENEIATYQRKVDYAFANELLDSLV